MLRTLVVAAAALSLAACGTLGRTLEFNGSDVVSVEVQGHKFDVQHHRQEPAVAVSRDIAGASGQGVVSGLTFGLVGGDLPPDLYRQAALKVVEPHGCSLTRFLALGDVAYEAHYTCPAGVDLRALMGAR